MTIQQMIAVLYLARFASNFNTCVTTRIVKRVDVLELQASLRVDMQDSYNVPSDFTLQQLCK